MEQSSAFVRTIKGLLMEPRLLLDSGIRPARSGPVPARRLALDRVTQGQDLVRVIAH